MRRAGVRQHLGLQPRPTRQLHLGPQSQQVLRFDGLDPPEVERGTRASAAPHPHPAESPVEEPPQLPQRVAGGPTVVVAEGAEDVEGAFRRGLDPMEVALEQQALMDRHLAALGLTAAHTGQARRPGSLDVIRRIPNWRIARSSRITTSVCRLWIKGSAMRYGIG